MQIIPEELKEDILRWTNLDIKEKPDRLCYLVTVDAKGNWSLIPRLYELKETKKGTELREFKYKVKGDELQVRKRLAKEIIERLDEPIRKGIGKEIGKALLEKPRALLEDMAGTKGKINLERKRGCFWIVDQNKNEFSL